MTAAARLADAYRILGVAPNDVLLAPKVTPLLQRLCGGTGGTPTSRTARGVAAAITYLRASSESAARRFILVYDDPALSAALRRALPIEAFCLAAKLDPTELLGPITRVAHLHGAMIGAVKAAERHPDVVQASLDAATERDKDGRVVGSSEDRMANLKHMGYLPTAKGSQVNVQVNANATANAAAKSDSTALAAPEDTIRRIVEARQRSAAALTASQQAALPPAPPGDTIPQAFMPRGDRVPVTVDADYSDVGDADEEA